MLFHGAAPVPPGYPLGTPSFLSFMLGYMILVGAVRLLLANIRRRPE